MATIDGKNPNPIIIKAHTSVRPDELEQVRKKLEVAGIDDFDFDEDMVYDVIATIKDPEHPLTLEQLDVVKPHLITVDNENYYIRVEFTPTIPNCSMATLIGLMIRTKLNRNIPSKYKVDVYIEAGKHDQQKEISKQLNDKERYLAALENEHLAGIVNDGIQDNSLSYR
ncbi:UNKNOWN [Stylonychia lemnae]|uniref:MIP18 family-like domain-containing protein n=1 Tax=Stylonychia lemnae TaxID=5949 RepID=A0A077ZRJ2_STYLE|nr:UNKNOWN [Stylonychia lemnae]|eukprot:CDW72084.1 UNKNOWN [Stylonychia lemnae]